MSEKKRIFGGEYPRKRDSAGAAPIIWRLKPSRTEIMEVGKLEEDLRKEEAI